MTKPRTDAVAHAQLIQVEHVLATFASEALLDSETTPQKIVDLYGWLIDAKARATKLQAAIAAHLEQLRTHALHPSHELDAGELLRIADELERAAKAVQS